MQDIFFFELFNGYATAADPSLVAGVLRLAERVRCSAASPEDSNVGKCGSKIWGKLLQLLWDPSWSSIVAQIWFRKWSGGFLFCVLVVFCLLLGVQGVERAASCVKGFLCLGALVLNGFGVQGLGV